VQSKRRAPGAASTPTGTSTQARSVTKLRTIDEVADLFNVSPRTVRRLIGTGAMPVHRFGRVVRISDADIAAFLLANRSV
jgi:excisionase family DNA binding protein